ncbi:hypothetical protein PS15m_002240 [Mucor circinelloides]
MASSQNPNDNSLTSIDLKSDYGFQLNQLLQEAQIGLDRLNHNVVRLNDGLQTMAAVGSQFAKASHLWISFHMSIKTKTNDETKSDEDGKNPEINQLDFEESMLEREPEEDERREKKQQRFVHNTMNDTADVDNSSFGRN